MNRRALLKRSLLGITLGSFGFGSLQAIVKAAQTPVDHPYWGYTGNTDPSKWGELSAAYAMCATGSEQSPINLTEAVDTALTSLTLNYQATPLKLKNTGRTIQADYAPGSTLLLNDAAFELKQFHFHAPSEHLKDGTPMAMEIHFVHQHPETKTLAVIGVFLKEGLLNAALQPIWSHMPTQAGVEKAVSGRTVNAASLLPANTNRFYQYHGSLTTPPCAEIVNWIVMKEPISVSQGQVTQFIQAIGEHNARPVQPLNQRLLLGSTINPLPLP